MLKYFFNAPNGNFGDDINKWIWDDIFGPEFFVGRPNELFIGIGTILDHYIPQYPIYHVFGSGVGYHPLPKTINDPVWNIHCVRGPLSAMVLNLSKSKAITDGAILIALLDEFQPVPTHLRKGVAFMPHISAIKTADWRGICKFAGLTYLDPREDCKKTIHMIRNSKLVIADAMHAAIVADSVRVPWIPVSTSGESNSFKWQDWTKSIQVQYSPEPLLSGTLLDCIKAKFLSLMGLNYTIEEHNKDDHLIKHFEIICHRKLSKFYKFRERTATYILNKIISIADSKILASRTSINRYNEYVISKLSALAKLNGYLSDDINHNLALERMQYVIDKFKRL